LKRLFNKNAAFSIRESNGTYRTATNDDIIQEALAIIDAQFAKGTAITSASKAQDFLKLQLAHLEHEVFAILWLDTAHKVIAFEKLFRGTVEGASVYPREIVKSALEHNASACILCHNHPSGSGKPSQADRAITEKIKQALDMIDIKTIDHMIVGKNTYSFAEHGLL
jgi:DNA repair protein RadC